jgi:hypothetical protein
MFATEIGNVSIATVPMLITSQSASAKPINLPSVLASSVIGSSRTAGHVQVPTIILVICGSVRSFSNGLELNF